MDLSLIFVLIFAYARLICSTPEPRLIGAFFAGDDYESELAFNTSVVDSRLQRPTFTPIVKRVPKSDLFATGVMLNEILNSGQTVAAIFGPPSTYSSTIVQSICTSFEIPHVQYHWKPSYSDSRIAINMYPDANLLAKGLATVVRHMSWKSYVILYEDDDGLVRLQDVLKAHSGDFPMAVKKLKRGRDYRSVLKGIKNFTGNSIILDCDTDHILPILEQAKEVNLLEYYHSYLLTSLDAHTLNFSSLQTQANITTLRLMDPNSKHLAYAVNNWQWNNQHAHILQHNVKLETALVHDGISFFTTAYLELQNNDMNAYDELENDENAYDGIRISQFMKAKTADNLLTGPAKFDDFGNRIDFRLDVIEIHGASNKAEKIAEWRPEFGSSLNITKSDTTKMQQIVEHLQQTTMIVSSRIGPPYLRMRKPKHGEKLVGNDRYEGYSMDLITEIAKMLNFTFEFRLTEGGKYGNYDPETKSWNGLIRDLLEREAHLAICDLTVTHMRLSAVDFSLPFMTLGVSILYKKANIKEDQNKFAFMDPLDFEVWVYTVTLFLIVSIVLYITFRMAPGDWENPHPCDQDPEELENIWDLKNCFWLTLGSIMTQGCDILPKGISSRMATSMWWFFSLIMTSSYTANLAAFLTMERMGATITSAEDLAKQTKIKYGTVEGGATQAFFRDSNFSTFSRMWAQMQQSRPSVFEKSNEDGVRRVNNTKNQLYAFLMESSSIKYEIQKNCNLRQVGGQLDSRSYGIAMPMNSPYRSAIDHAILTLQESGKLNDLRKRWWEDKVEKEVSCDEKELAGDGASAELALANVGGVFIVLGIGISIAFLLAFVEFLWNVQQVAVEEHITYCEALWVELKFATKVWITKKSVKPLLSESSSDASTRSGSRSIAQKVMQGAGSFLNLEVFDKISIQKKK